MNILKLGTDVASHCSPLSRLKPLRLRHAVALAGAVFLAQGLPLLASSASAQSSLPTFTCEADGYNVFGTPSNLQRFDPATRTVVSSVPLNLPINLNGIGFSPIDNYIYGNVINANGQIGFTTGDFARLGVDGTVESLGAPMQVAGPTQAFNPITATGTDRKSVV